MTSLKNLGWDDFFQSQLDKNETLIPGRISTENKTNYFVHSEFGEIIAEVSGRLFFSTESKSELPKTGDWVLLDYFEDEKKGIIQKVLERKTKLSRKAAGGKTEEQVFAANVDYVMIVHPIDESFNYNKLDRQLVVAYQSKAEPIVVLSKSDLCENIDDILQSINDNHNVQLIPTSTVTNDGINELKETIGLGKTYVLIGSSGVGKSTLINKLFGKDILKTQEVRSFDNKGKHTTTHRELIVLPTGGILIDNPGIRELQLWNSEDGLSQTFGEFSDYEDQCKYKDCTHTVENGCAVLLALENGEISQKRYENYLKMRKELAYLETKQNDSAAMNKKNKWKNISKEIKRYYKNVKDKGQ